MHELASKLQDFLTTFQSTIDRLTSNNLLDHPVREGGWTPRQIIHHLSDTQAQAYYRIKWIIAEDNTIIKPFDQNVWIEISKNDDLNASISLVKAIYSKWITMTADLSPELLEKQAFHPEAGVVTLKPFMEYYINHGQNHLNQIINILK